jgi:NAD(P)-dependent dehydrogenase (short-subunit alcohol dehydrogenase family)
MYSALDRPDPTGRCAIVTGGFGVLGAAVGRALLAAGYAVALVGRGAPPPSLQGNDQAGLTLISGVDLSRQEEATRTVQEALDAMGAVHVLVNTAGAFKMTPTSEDSGAIWDALYQANVKTCLNTCAAVLPHLSAGARIINIGAATAARATAVTGAYAAAKSSVARLTESLADQLQARQITVNALLPSIIDTPQNRRDRPAADPSGCMVGPAAIAKVVLFLASPASRVITGALIPVTSAA